MRLRGRDAATNFPPDASSLSAAAPLAAAVRPEKSVKPKKPAAAAKAYSNYRGVTRNRGRWVSQIVVHKKFHYLGCFPDELSCARAYDR